MGVDAAHERSPSTPGRIVLVSDDADTRIVFCRLAKRWSSRVWVTASVEAGLAFVRERRARVVVLDSGLGVETEKLLVELRGGVDTSRIPIVVFGDDASAYERAALTLLGASAYLPKPLILSEVDRVIQELADRVVQELSDVSPRAT
jgi:DNA-binding response OmpR family regulator